MQLESIACLNLSKRINKFIVKNFIKVFSNDPMQRKGLLNIKCISKAVLVISLTTNLKFKNTTL